MVVLEVITHPPEGQDQFIEALWVLAQLADAFPVFSIVRHISFKILMRDGCLKRLIPRFRTFQTIGCDTGRYFKLVFVGEGVPDGFFFVQEAVVRAVIRATGTAAVAFFRLRRFL